MYLSQYFYASKSATNAARSALLPEPFGAHTSSATCSCQAIAYLRTRTAARTFSHRVLARVTKLISLVMPHFA